MGRMQVDPEAVYHAIKREMYYSKCTILEAADRVLGPDADPPQARPLTEYSGPPSGQPTYEVTPPQAVGEGVL